MIAVIVEPTGTTFRIGQHVFPVTAEECRALGEALSMSGVLGEVIETAAEWSLGTRWKLELGGPDQRPYDDRRNRVVLHCDGKKWHLLPTEAENLGTSFAAAAGKMT